MRARGSVTLVQGDLFNYCPCAAFDLVYDRASFTAIHVLLLFSIPSYDHACVSLMSHIFVCCVY
jgi:hypothetical protein